MEHNHPQPISGGTNEEPAIPIVKVRKIMRRALPQYARITTGAKESMQACVSEFIGIITSEANAKCKEEHRHILSADDIIWAMDRFGFEDYIEPLDLYLRNYRMSRHQCEHHDLNTNGSGTSGSHNGNN